MGDSNPTTVIAISDERPLTLGELCRCCDLAADHLLDMVSEGLLPPQPGDPGAWRFSSADLWRIHRALRLQRDLGTNLAGAALALDLMDEMQRLRARVRLLEQLLD